MELTAIGHIERTENGNYIVVDERYAEGLLGIEGFSHIVVMYWLDKNDTPEKRAILQVHPRRDMQNPLTGVFATRSPVRPNPIGLATCELLSIDGLRLQIGATDAFDGTPVVDIKCYTGEDAARGKARYPGWL
ncbi:MAG: tRNA (N6-threonylcarbamoyladenosine(37)-N6)-methyltransferase TrmO [Spirochaetales bacterium]|nr:tRNA (N6-threonylcarbamoyladenosine(37)-N6)-methyltransferase TrmO [Spirochaetales bacterium]